MIVGIVDKLVAGHSAFFHATGREPNAVLLGYKIKGRLMIECGQTMLARGQDYTWDNAQFMGCRVIPVDGTMLIRELDK